MRRKESSMVYPERPGEPDCTFYVRYGECGYGSRCRFNHPPASTTQLADQAGSSQRHFPERIGQPDCQGERECMHYARTGACKFGLNCKFHHPQPANGGALASTSNTQMYALGTYPTLDRIPLLAMPLTHLMARGSYLPGLQIPTPTSYPPVILSPQWELEGPIRPVTPLDRNEQSPRTNTNTKHGKESVTKSGQPVPSVGVDLPEREEQPECLYFLRTGDCRFGASCKFHHPKRRTPIASPSSCPLSIIGLPFCFGEPQCSFYAWFGICKFGPVCKLDHPPLLPYYNALGTRPVISMAMSSMDGTPGASAANNSSAGKWKWSRDVAELTKEEEQDAGSVELSRADETGEGVEGTES